MNTERTYTREQIRAAVKKVTKSADRKKLADPVTVSHDETEAGGEPIPTREEYAEYVRGLDE